VLALCALPLVLIGADGPTARPTFLLHSADGRSRTGSLHDIGKDWSIELAGADAISIKGREVVSLRRADLPLPAPAQGPQVILANGSRLPGKAVRVANDRMEFIPDSPVRVDGDKALRLPLSGVSAIWLAEADAGSAQGISKRRATQPRASDLILLRNGDRIEGTFQSMDRTILRVEGERKKTVEVAVAQVAAVIFNPDLVSRKKPKGPYGHLVLTGGGRLAVTWASLESDRRTLRCKLPTGARLYVPLDAVAALDIRQGCAIYLSDLKPKSFEHTPYFGVRWPFVTDGSVAGGSLRLGESTFDKGLGLHTRSRLTYSVPKGCRAFEALVGLDVQTGRRGRARAQVLVDGKPAALSGKGELAARQKPLAIRVDVSGARELTLFADFGRFGGVQGHVDWADARLIR
jgi:hypothetical protein